MDEDGKCPCCDEDEYYGGECGYCGYGKECADCGKIRSDWPHICVQEPKTALEHRMKIPNQEEVDWSAVSDAVGDAISDGEGSPGAKDLERAFKSHGLLVANEEETTATRIAIKREVLHQIARYVAGPPQEPQPSSTILAMKEAASKIAEATAIGGEIEIIVE